MYTEPADRAHFAETRDAAVVLQITGEGPTGLHYIEMKAGEGGGTAINGPTVAADVACGGRPGQGTARVMRN